jgi:hypothetical protein
MDESQHMTPPSQPETYSPKQSIWKDPKKRWWLIGGLSTLVALVAGGAIYAATRTTMSISNTPTVATPITPTPTPAQAYSKLDGMLVTSEEALRHPLAVMIENHTLARPQSGLGSASIVYESIVEGGITRYMAVFDHTLPEKVGPVRSARTQFIDFAEEFQPVSAYYAHVGGSIEGLAQVKGDNIYDLDQGGIGEKAFHRFPKLGLPTEHTMYGFPTKLYDVAKERGYKTESTVTSWKFKEDEAASTRPDSQTITIPFSSALYEVKYNYDKGSNSYKRVLGGTDHKDVLTGNQLSPRNVIVQFAAYAPAPNSKKGVQMVTLVGEGTAKIFRDGKTIEAKWKKTKKSERTIYTDAASGAEIEFNRGQIWIEVPKTGTTITVK